jgi:hypothetical protein
MGMYINMNSKGEQLGHDKVQSLIADGATRIARPSEFKPNLVCVVDNGYFQAAAYCYSQGEFDAFTEPSDLRPKTWLSYPHAQLTAM